MEIIHLLVLHIHGKDEEYWIKQQMICREKYYSNIHSLLNKPFCSQWHLSQFPVFQSFCIALIGKGISILSANICLLCLSVNVRNFDNPNKIRS